MSSATVTGHRGACWRFFSSEGQRSPEVFLRRCLVAPLALLVEVHRRGMQPERNRRRFDRAGGMTVIFLRELVEHELVRAAALPQKIGIQFGRRRLGHVHEPRHGRVFETQQHVARLDLGALAMRCFHLQRGSVVSHDARHLDGAVFFVEYVHSGNFCVSRRR